MENYSFDCIVRDVPGAEGPCVDNQGRIFMVAPGKGRVLQIMPDGAAREVIRYEGIPAGLQLDRQGHLWIADMKRGVLRLEPDSATLHEEVVQFDGKPIRGCNDCCFDSKGNLYFTAPAGSNVDKPVGEVYCRLQDGRVYLLDGGYQFSNGLAVTADDSTLIVAETFTKKLWAYDISTPGQVKDKRHWGTLPGEHRGGPDGMDFDREGNLLAANWGGSAVEVFDSRGQLLERIMTPFASPSNVHFTGPGAQTLLITEHTSNGLWRTNWRHAGQQQYGWTR